jgi:hypothetical protein
LFLQSFFIKNATITAYAVWFWLSITACTFFTPIGHAIMQRQQATFFPTEGISTLLSPDAKYLDTLHP